MAVVSATRLRLRRPWLIVPFSWYSLRIVRQIRRSPGFLGGVTAREPDAGGIVFWTVTVWTDAAAMSAFRTSGIHALAMRKVGDWSDETSYGHWEQAGDALPTLADAHRRMHDVGATTRLRRATAAHRAGVVASDAIPVKVFAIRAK